MRSRADRRTRGIGFLLGAGLAVAALLSWRIPPGHTTLGAAVTVVTQPSGELAISPGGTLINATAMKPSSASSAETGELHVRNETGANLEVHLRGVASQPDLNDALMVDVSSGKTSIFSGTLGEFRSWSDDGVAVDPGARASFRVSTWLPPSLKEGYQGRTTSVDLEFKSVQEASR
ncbi:MAG: hypothetical protein ACJ76P_01240 [Actinomycetota bacterium]